MAEDGTSKPVFMGSYGIGPTRLMGIVAEAFADDKGLVWPEEVAPYTYHLVSLAAGDEQLTALAEDLYRELQKKGDVVLYDDRDARAGEKFADADLMGMPYRIIVGKETLASGRFEVVNRKTGEVEKLLKEELLAR